MAHVTFFRMKAKKGEKEAVVDLFDKWQRERMPEVKGFVRSCVVQNLNDDHEFMAEVMFDTRENYQNNSDDKEQGEWFKDLRSHLVEDPVWFDGRLERESGAMVP
jgi:hypothetical protein